MKLFVASVLLLVPLVFAASQPSGGKIIFRNGDVLAEFANQRPLPMFTYRRDASVVNFFVQIGQNPLTDSRPVMKMSVNFADSTKELSFVIQLDEQTGSCMSNSNSELRPLIESCEGDLFIRSLSPEETSQMETLQANVNEISQAYVFHEKDHLVIEAVQLQTFQIKPYYDGLKMLAYVSQDKFQSRNGRELLFQAMFHDFEDKRFSVESTPNGPCNCKSSPVSGLRVQCYGNVKITDNKRVLNHRAPKNPAQGNRDIPLDDLSREELKKLLKGILDRL